MSMFRRNRRVIVTILSTAISGGFSSGAVKANDERPRIPQEAVDACRDKGRGDACTVSFRGHEIQGTCFDGDGEKEALFCRPSGPPPGM